MAILKVWQWAVLALPMITIIIFLLIAAAQQIHLWGINWIWAVFTLVFVAWRWLLVTWTKPTRTQIEAIVLEVQQELESATDVSPKNLTGNDPTIQAQAALQEIIKKAQADPPLWENWSVFWQRCQELVTAIAYIYYPQVKHPLLNIYIPQASTLIRGTVDDLDLWIQKLSPILNQVTIGQAYQAYELYHQLEPSVRKFWQGWSWIQWILNPVAAIAKTATQPYSTQANQELLGNLSNLLREVALKNLCRQAIILYSGSKPPTLFTGVTTPTLPKADIKTLREILEQAEPITEVEQKPVNILLVGRTGSGKSSLINTLFQADLATVDVLPSTDQIKNYHWQIEEEEALTLWDTPGYEQINRPDFREEVLNYAHRCDLLLLVTPALDPALQMDLDMLKQIKTEVADLPVIAVITQVDRLRPLREWEPPYNWQLGEKPKEISIRDAIQYRTEMLGEYCNLVLPVITSDLKTNRSSWGVEAISLSLMTAIAPAKQLRFARFLGDLEARTVAASQIIDRYTLQMTTTQGITTLLKSPVLKFISTLSTGSPNLAYLLAEKIPIEQLPMVIGKLQMAYDLFSLLSTEATNLANFDLLSLWTLLLENPGTPDRNAWAFGHALVEYWTKKLSIAELRERFNYYLNI